MANESGRNLLRIRNQARMTIAEAAYVAGIPASQIEALESGKEEATVMEIKKLSMTYGHNLAAMVSAVTGKNESNPDLKHIGARRKEMLQKGQISDRVDRANQAKSKQKDDEQSRIAQEIAKKLEAERKEREIKDKAAKVLTGEIEITSLGKEEIEQIRSIFGKSIN